ncbi:hypothetical protein LG296_06680 [Ureibacillus chungkukjangi]|uniref:hypothetical protein n=1 Tax=Ureibacillus chungkukjangi TaxID=1202712 RepID=UPI00385050CA
MKKKIKKKIKKRHKWKYILLSIVLLLLVVGGYTLYIFKFKTYDVADPEIEKITEENYTLNLPDGTELVIDGNGKVVEEQTKLPVAVTGTNNQSESSSVGDSQGVKETNTASSQQGNTNNSTAPSTGAAKTPTTNTKTEKPTVAEIKSKYKPTLEALEAQASGKINGLVSQAKAEYQKKKANGEKISVAYFYQKYMGAATALEGSTDAVFDSVMAIVETDFVVNGYSPSYGDSFRSEYAATKERLRKSLYDKAMSSL